MELSHTKKEQHAPRLLHLENELLWLSYIASLLMANAD